MRPRSPSIQPRKAADDGDEAAARSDHSSVVVAPVAERVIVESVACGDGPQHVDAVLQPPEPGGGAAAGAADLRQRAAVPARPTN